MYHIPTPEELRKLRKEANLTQSDLAKLANVSQSLIARIENKTIDPRVSTLKKIINAILKANESKQKVMDIAVKNVITIKDNDFLSNAAKIMNENGISQLIVLNENNNIVGSIREKSITGRLLEKGEEILKEKVLAHLDESFPEISASASLDEIKPLFLDNDAIVLISKGKIMGIITKADIIKFYQS